jgi:hypothetical protein
MSPCAHRTIIATVEVILIRVWRFHTHMLHRAGGPPAVHTPGLKFGCGPGWLLACSNHVQIYSHTAVPVWYLHTMQICRERFASSSVAIEWLTRLFFVKYRSQFFNRKLSLWIVFLLATPCKWWCTLGVVDDRFHVPTTSSFRVSIHYTLCRLDRWESIILK